MDVRIGIAKRCLTGAVLVALVMAGGVPTAVAETVTRSVTLTGPERAEANVATTYSGRLTVDSVGVPNETVAIIVDDTPVAFAVTALDGTYAVGVTFTQFGVLPVRAVAYRDTVIELQSAVLNVAVPSYDDSAAPSLFQATKFLYTGPDAVQTGVDLAALDPAATAVLRGSVTTRDGTALEGVEVRIAGHDEFGVTTTGATGGLDMVVNGGQPLVVDYQKLGFIPVQREVTPSWRDYESVPDVVMTPYDPVVTTVDLASPAMQVAQGSASSDSDGVRQSTLLFPPAVDAVMTLPDGSVQMLDSLSVRATEFTVGDAGPEAMPGDLPPESGYTYAVEFSADEAVNAGATMISFTEPVINYVENFLGFPVGTPVPTGYYDREERAWSASGDGMVVGIVAVADGVADVDIDGDGLADAPTELAALGITDAERAELGGLYTPGQSLWRVPIPHFTPWDHNWPYGLPSDAEPPGQEPASSTQSSTQCTQAGSIIGCENQTLGETLPVAGTPFFLRYDSARAPGRTADRALAIPLTGATLPASLKRVDVRVTVAGRTQSQSFQAAPSLTHTFIWDGVDAYGRRVQGTQTAKVRIGYVYDAVYYGPTAFGTSFGRAGGAPIERSPTRNEITVSQQYDAAVGGLFDKGVQSLGGWTLSAHHTYDVEGRVLQLGTGERRAVDAMAPGITALAGNGQAGAVGEGTYTGDGGRAADAGLSFVKGITVASDGSVYIADTGNGVVRRVTREGVISTIAGGGSPAGGNGDGGPATSAKLIAPTDVAVGSDGSVYVSDPGSARVRRVDSEGVISTFAGGGNPADGLGDGGLATSAALESPRGLAIGPGGSVYVVDAGQKRVRRISADAVITTVAGGGTPADGLGDGLRATDAVLALPLGVAVDGAGTLYIADANQHRVRAVSRDGTIRTYAGTGAYGHTGDGGPAPSARVGYPVGVAVDPVDGGVVFSQRFHHRVRKVSPDGTLMTVAGTGADGRSGDKGPPLRATLHEPHDVAVDPDGTLLIADTDNFQVRRVAAPLPGFGTADFMLPSEDGTEIYQFDPNGRHLRTLDALTNAVVYRFSRDAGGQLSQLEDAFGNVTTIERDASGSPTGIVSPFGPRTSLVLNEDGYLKSVTNPANETVTLGYGNGGLLTSFTTAGGSSTFGYDSLGRLIRDGGADGDETVLALTSTESGYRVTATSALGRTTTYEMESISTGGQRRRVTDPAGGVSEAVSNPDGTVTATAPDGTVTTSASGPDPRWGMLVPTLVSLTTTRPSGGVSVVTGSRSAVLSDPLNPLSLTQLTDAITADGRTSTRTWKTSSRTLTTTTPSGRTQVTTLNALGQPVSQRFADLAPLSFTRDAQGRVTDMSQGTGAAVRTSSFGFDTGGYLASITTPLTQTVRVNDAVGRATNTTLPGSRVVGYDYDAAGNLEGITPPGRPAHAFTYTAGGVNDSYAPPVVAGITAPATTHTYDDDLSSTSTVLPDGRTVTYGYDGQGRPTTTTFSRGVIERTYDGPASRTQRLTGPDGQALSYTYDGSLVSTITTEGVNPATIAYGYGTGMRLDQVTINGANSTPFGYDADGLTTSAGALTFARDAVNGQVEGTTVGVVGTAHTYSEFGEALSSTASASGVPVFAVGYERDALGRIVKATETTATAPTVREFVYDGRGWLGDVKTDGVVTEHYEYDANGNRTQAVTAAGTSSGTYDDQDRLTGYGAASYAYSANGQLLSKTTPDGITSYSYDELGSLSRVELPTGVVVAYTLDPLGRPVATTRDGVVTRRLLYGAGSQPLAEVDQNGVVTTQFVYGSGAHVPDYMVKGGVPYRVVTDQVGSVRFVIDATTGAIAQHLEYDAFGRVTLDTAPGFQPFGFAGGLTDPDTGLVRFGVRDYDPETGRWTAKDPLGFEAGELNLYAYAGNDPVNVIDPDGGLPILIPVVLGAVAVFEAAATAHDIYSAGQALMDECASGIVQTIAVAGAVGGAFLPGGGYGTAGRAVVSQGDEAIRGGVYVLRDPPTGQVMRTGRTKHLDVRKAQHKRDPALRQYEFETVERTDVYAEQRGLEQFLHDTHVPPLNKVRPISPRNPRREQYLRAADEYFARRGGPQ